MLFIQQTWMIIKREFRRMTSRPIYFFAIIFAPLMSGAFLISLMWHGLPTDLPIAVVDEDNSSLSRNLTRQLDAFQQTRVTERYADFQSARISMQEGNIYGIYMIPRNFSSDVTAGRQPKLSFYTNNSFLIAGSLLFRDMKMMSVLASGAASRSIRLAKGENMEEIMGQLQPIVIDTHAIGNPWLNYSIYLNNLLLPGVLQLLVLLVTVFSIGTEIKEGSARKWLEMADNSLPKALLGKLLPYTIAFVLMGIFNSVILYKYLDFPMHGSIWTMIFAITLFVLSSQALGVFMIGVLPTLRLGLSFASLFGVLSLSLSGFSFPVLAMDKPLQWASELVPLHHYFLIYVDQALNGIPILYSLTSFISLFLFTLTPWFVMSRLQKALLRNKYKM